MSAFKSQKNEQDMKMTLKNTGINDKEAAPLPPDDTFDLLPSNWA